MASEWKYVPVRRTALFLEESIERGTRWAAFEPNDEPLWSRLRLAVGSFLHELFRQGAFQGRTDREAYFVACDASTTTQADIDAGVVTIEIGFAPLKPAEFVVLRIRQRTALPGVPARTDPYRNFKFQVRFDSVYVAGMSAASGLEPTSQVAQGPPPDVGLADVDSIVLERGVTEDEGFASWLTAAVRRDLTLEVFDEAGRVVSSYLVIGARVAEHQALPDLDAGANTIAVTSIRIEHLGCERLNPSPSGA
jgi:phage tail-like protein